MIDTIVVVDTETTGLEPSEGAALLEIAWCAVARGLEAWEGFEPGTYGSRYVEHYGPIPAAARGVHHISPADVAPGAPNCCSRESLVHSLTAAETPELVYAAHNAAYDSKFLPELRPAGWICTMRCAMHLWPDAPDLKAQTLRYWLEAEPPAALLAGLGAHRALYDTACTAALLLRMLELRTPDQLLRLTETPVLQKTCRFGKHRGSEWADVPKDYLRWMLTKSDLCVEDADLRHTVRHHLGLH